METVTQNQSSTQSPSTNEAHKILVNKALTEIQKVIIGNTEVLKQVLIALFCRGHILFEGSPGVAKTTLVKALQSVLGMSFKRVQFTPDLLPSDITGTLVYNPEKHIFETIKGPIFANIVLADEINRAPAKVQAALLEAMQERQVTIGDTTYALPEPFFVCATQNPIEHEGTYALPEAQLDRFFFKIFMNHPTPSEEIQILTRKKGEGDVQRVFTPETFTAIQQAIQDTYIDNSLIEYIATITHATRKPKAYKLNIEKYIVGGGVSTRGAQAMLFASKAHAFLMGRDYVIPDDIQYVAIPALRHRILLSFAAEQERITGDILVQMVLDTIPTP